MYNLLRWAKITGGGGILKAYQQSYPQLVWIRTYPINISPSIEKSPVFGDLLQIITLHLLL